MPQRLADFRLDAGVYGLGQFTPVSIRDQIVRAHYLIAALVETGELTPASKLIICGGGFAGVACALSAHAAGLGEDKILLIDQNEVCLGLQAKNTTRWLDPVQYDWPARHWDAEVWPVPGTITGLFSSLPELKASTSSKWAQIYFNSLLGTGIELMLNERVCNWSTERSGQVKVTLESDVGKKRPKAPHFADVLIMAVGFGSEISNFEDLSGEQHAAIPFWSDDKFESVDQGLPEFGPILVSGSGDGALQDFVRLTCGVSSVRTLIFDLYKITSPTSKWKAAFEGLWHWEDHAKKSRNFFTQEYDECEVLSRLQKAYDAAVDELISDSEDWAKVTEHLNVRTQNRKRGNITLLAKCTHFTWCYPLNRVAVLILIRYFSQMGQEVLIKNSALVNATPELKAASSNAWGCKHKVTLAHGTDCSVSGGAIRSWLKNGKETSSEEYLGLVIRHGIRPIPKNSNVELRLKIQDVPLHLP